MTATIIIIAVLVGIVIASIMGTRVSIRAQRIRGREALKGNNLSRKASKLAAREEMRQARHVR